MPARAAIPAPNGVAHKGPIPTGVRLGNLIFLSAVRGGSPETAEEEATQVFRNLTAILENAGSGLDAIARIGVFVRDIRADLAAFDDAWTATFGDNPPARFVVQVSDFGRKGSGRYLCDVIAVAAQSITE